MRLLLAVVLALFATSAFAAAPENAALALVVADQQKLTPAERLTCRYIWIPADWTPKGWFVVPEDVQAVSLTVNYYGQEKLIARPTPLGGGALMVLRVDLRQYAGGSTDDLNNLIKFWEEFQFDPKFSLLITKDVLKFLDVKVPTVKKTIQEKVAITVKPFVQDGKTYTQRWETRQRVIEVPFAEADVAVVRVPSEHLDLNLYEAAAEAAQSRAPLVSSPYFITRGLETIQYPDKDRKDEVYRTIYGGLYYGLANIPRAGKKGTDLDALFEFAGIGNVQAGVDVDAVFEKRRSDAAGAIITSDVTKKKRKWRAYPTLLTLEGGLLVITDDIRNQDIDIGDDPLANLIKTLKSNGRPVHETIYSKANGLHGFTLHNDEGKLADSVPETVAKDTTVPRGHTGELQAAIGCIRCHANDRGWKKLTNDVPGILKGYLDIFGDNADRRRSADETLIRLAGLYSGNVEETLLPVARDRYANAVLRATGAWKDSKDQTDVVERASAHISKIVERYKYQTVDAARALTEMGFDVPETLIADVTKKGTVPDDVIAVIANRDDAVKVVTTRMLRSLLPPVGVVIDGVIPEDWRAAALKNGKAINRTDWDLFYAFAASRAAKSAAMKK